MSIFEYDKEEEERKLRKAEYEAGEQRGRMKERLEIVQSLMEHGMSAAEIAGILKISEKDVLEMVKEE